MSLATLDWHPQLLEFFDCPIEALPKIVSNSEVYGNFYEGHQLQGLPIAGLVGDQQAALVGNKCLERGEAKQTYGTCRDDLSGVSVLICRVFEQEPVASCKSSCAHPWSEPN